MRQGDLRNDDVSAVTTTRGALALTSWHRFNAAALDMLARLSRGAVPSLLFLVALCFFSYGPGFLRLPPIDRTEVVYAETSREMLEEGRIIDPRYMGERERHRPIGNYWAQMASAGSLGAVIGSAAKADIRAYRLPSLIAVGLAVALTLLLLRPLIGGRQALIAGALFAVSPIAALQAQLGIAESVTLAPAVAAQLALLRLYASGDDDRRRGMASLFWISQGIAITLDALLVPILTVATLVALWVMDRDLGWLRRLKAWWGIPVMLVLGSPWIMALTLAEGGMPFSGLSPMEVTKALGGAQAMKFKAWPLTFCLGLLAGLVFCSPLLVPAARRLWEDRQRSRVGRFLLAWLAGYLAYLELISSKPALYSVQVMLPAATAAVALALARERDDAPLDWPGTFPAWPGYLFSVAVPMLYFAAQRLADARIGAGAVLLSVPAAVLLALAAHAAGSGRAAAWLVLTVAGAAVFLATTFGALMPLLTKGWTTEVIAAAARPLSVCAGGPAAVIGYREPSAVFAFRPRNVHLSADGWQPSAGAVAVEQRQLTAFQARAGALGMKTEPKACLETINVTRGCGLNFTVFVVSGSEAPSSCPAVPVPECAAGGPRVRKPCS